MAHESSAHPDWKTAVSGSVAAAPRRACLESLLCVNYRGCDIFSVKFTALVPPGVTLGVKVINLPDMPTKMSMGGEAYAACLKGAPFIFVLLSSLMNVIGLLLPET